MVVHISARQNYHLADIGQHRDALGEVQIGILIEIVQSHHVGGQTENQHGLFGLEHVGRRAVVAGFDGGKMTSDASVLLPGATDQAIGLIDRCAQCFSDSR
jgi:hypothetical protein